MLSVWTFLATITVLLQDLAAPAYAAVIDEYILVGQAKNYSDAQSYCRSEYDSDLASIHSDGDNNACKALCATVGNTKIDCWIGLSAQEGVFVFEDQSEFDYGTDVSGGVLPWSNLNNKSNPSGGSENCVELRGKDVYNWNDQQCATENYFLCNANPNSGRASTTGLAISTTSTTSTTSQDPATSLPTSTSTSIVSSTLQSLTSTAAAIAETSTSIVVTSTIIQSLASATGERASQTKSPTGSQETMTSTSELQTQARQSSGVESTEISSIAIVASISGCVALAAVAMCLAVYYWKLQQSGKKQKVEGEEEDKAQPQQDFDLEPEHGVAMVIVDVQHPVPQPTLTPPRPTLIPPRPTPQSAPRKGERGGPDLSHELQYELQRHQAEGERSSVLNTTNAVASQFSIAAHENDSDDDSFSDAYKQTAQTIC